MKKCRSVKFGPDAPNFNIYENFLAHRPSFCQTSSHFSSLRLQKNMYTRIIIASILLEDDQGGRGDGSLGPDTRN